MSEESKIIDDDAMPSGSSEPAPDLEPTAEEILLQQEQEDARKRAEILSQTSEGDNVFIKRSVVGAPIKERAYICTLSVDEWMADGIEYIARKYGGGHYFCQIKMRNGRFMPNSSWEFKVDKSVVGEIDRENNKDEVVKAIEKMGAPKQEDGLLKTVLEIQNAKGSDTMAMMMAMMKMTSEQNAQAQQSQAAMMSAMMTAMATMSGNKSGSELKELIAPLMAAALAPKKETSTKEMIETFVQMKQLMGGENTPHEDSLLSTIGKMAPPVISMIAQGMTQPIPQPLPAPQPAPAPNMEMLENQMIINRLLSLAEKNADPGFVCEMLGYFVNDAQMDQVEAFLNLPNWFELIAQQESRFAPYRAWLTGVREEFLRVEPEPELEPVPAPAPVAEAVTETKSKRKAGK